MWLIVCLHLLSLLSPQQFDGSLVISAAALVCFVHPSLSPPTDLLIQNPYSPPHSKKKITKMTWIYLQLSLGYLSSHKVDISKRNSILFDFISSIVQMSPHLTSGPFIFIHLFWHCTHFSPLKCYGKIVTIKPSYEILLPGTEGKSTYFGLQSVVSG